MTTTKPNGAELAVMTPESTQMFPWNTRFAQIVEDLWKTSWPHSFALGGDLEETDDGFVIELDLPGVDRKNITIDVADRRVSIRGTRTERKRTGVMRHANRTMGEFAFEFTLPADVDQKGATATLVEGVLTVHLHKTDQTTHRVNIT